MGIFDLQFSQAKRFLEGLEAQSETFSHRGPIQWLSGQKRDVVLGRDTAVELGSPGQNSVSMLLWTEEQAAVADNRIRVSGPRLRDCIGQSIPFGKIVFLAGSGFDESNSYERYRELAAVRYDLDLKGYMIRAASQYQKEWSRVSHWAMERDFSFQILGGALIEAYKAFDYIHGAEVVFVTSNTTDVAALLPIAQGAGRVVSAMNKMLEEMACDCDDCEYTDVCDEVSELKTMRDALRERDPKDDR